MRKVILGTLILIIIAWISYSSACAQNCPPGMVSYWRLDDEIGAIATDSVGTNDGGLAGATWTTGIVEGALSFDGINDYVALPSIEPLVFTLELWIRTEMVDPGSLINSNINNNSSCSHGYNLRLGDEITGPGKVDFIIDKSAGCRDATIITSDVAVNDNEWHHIVAVYDGSLTLFIDAVLQSDTKPSAYAVTGYGVLIGKVRSSLGMDQFFEGLLDEVSIYERALALEEIQQHYQNGLNGLGYCAEVSTGVTIDIKPGDETNSFNNDGHGVIPVAILGSGDLDVTQIDAETVQLEGMAVKAVGKSNKLLAHIEDVNEDGINDLVVKIEDADGVFEPGDTTATLTGNLYDGTQFEGTDTIRIVGNSAPPSSDRSKLTTTWAGIKSKR